MFGPMIEEEWNLFTAKMIRTSGARVVPLFFPGANSKFTRTSKRTTMTTHPSTSQVIALPIFTCRDFAIRGVPNT